MSAPAGRWREDLARACADGRPDPLTIVSLLRGVPRYTHRSVTDVVAITGYAYGTVSALRWLASRLPADVQRGDLTLQHHLAVAALPVGEQRRRLDEAAAERLTAVALRRRIEAEAPR